MKTRRVNEEEKWAEMFATGCWFMWKWRNHYTHDPTFELPRNAAELIRLYLGHYHCKWDEQALVKGSKVRTIISWKAPKQGWCKLNIDGIFSQVEEAGCEGMIHGDCGEWLKGYTLKLVVADVAEAKAWGVIEGLELCWDLGLRKIDVESDALEIVEAIKKNALIVDNRYVTMRMRELLKKDK